MNYSWLMNTASLRCFLSRFEAVLAFSQLGLGRKMNNLILETDEQLAPT
jgi:hypothetical protein